MKKDKTVRGVFLNINNSDICTFKNGLYFYFCSEARRDRFVRLVDKWLENKKEKLQTIYFPNTQLINLDLPFIIEYYKQTEDRGFRIETLNGAKIKSGAVLGDIEFTEDNQEG